VVDASAALALAVFVEPDGAGPPLGGYLSDSSIWVHTSLYLSWPSAVSRP
jgi:hypothetical protein